MLYTGYLLLGSNMGHSIKNLQKASTLIEQQIGEIIQTSSIYKTAAWGNTQQDDFYNQVLKISTLLTPDQLLTELLEIEMQMGRKRIKKWESRIIDLDILYYEDRIISKDHLFIPHPHLHQRRFTLVPLCEICATFIHPILGQTNYELLQICEDNLIVEKL